MNYIPTDPYMLLSFVNMKLRDFYDSLEQMCDDLDIDENELKTTLEAIGVKYDSDNNRFV